MTRAGSCACGSLRYTISGPVRDVLVCHCGACTGATGGPWAASAARRDDLRIADPGGLRWKRAEVSEHGASRGSCARCGTVLFWDAPGRETISFAVSTLTDASGIDVAAHIWTGPGAQTVDGLPAYPRGLPASIAVPWKS